MKPGAPKQSAMSAFLAPFLAAGDKEAIAQARKEYILRYKAAWRKAKRKTQKTFEISFNGEEWKILKRAKLGYNRSYTNFIKMSALAYCEKKYLVPDQLAYNTVCQALQMAYNKLKDLEEDNKLPETQSEELLMLFSSIGNTIERHLQNPQTQEELIVEAIQADPIYKSKILHLLETM